MIFCPLPGTPTITQGFGQNPDTYAAFGFQGHNGIDFGCSEGTTIFAPHDGVASIHDDGDQNYGLHVVIDSDKRRSILAHLSETIVSEGQSIYQGDPVAKSGNSGFSMGPHLHWTYKILKDGAVQNHENGFAGAVDVTEFTRLWLDQDMHHDAIYTDDALPYLEMTFASNVYMENPSRHA